MNKILFRVNSSSKIGLGHLMRCITLAKKYKTSKIIFACEDLKGNFNQYILDEGYNVTVLKNNKPKHLIQVIKEEAISFLVIDSYKIDATYERKIKEKTQVKLLCFDDVYKEHYCDIILNHNVYAKKEVYKKLVPSWCEIHAGGNYTLIRDEFIQQKKLKRKKEILIAMGGSDVQNLNEPIVKLLNKAHKDYRIHVITSSANKHLQSLQKLCLDYENVKIHVNSSKMAKLMAKSAFAIVTPSVTVHEVLFMKLPFIAIQVSSNQALMYKYLRDNNYDVLNKFSHKKLDRLLQKRIV